MLARSLAVALLAILLIAPGARAADLTIFAAASLKNAMDDVAAAWEETTGEGLAVSLAGSAVLARQIQQGAPADVFISANPDWMDVLEADGLIAAESRFDLLRNSIVLIAHGRAAPPVEIAPGFDLAGRLGDGRLAMALVDAVPAGIYGKAALTSLGVWEEVAPRVAQADNVRAALAFVSTGEAPYGVVYATDAAASDDVTIVGTFPADSHPPIIYPAAAIAGPASPLALRFLEFLASDAARGAFAFQGFGVIAG